MTATWKNDVDAHDYQAAADYLSIRWGEKWATEAARQLKRADLTDRRANDILRACDLTAAPVTDPGVMHDLLKLATHEQLSPVLIVATASGVDIADGYHRVSLAYDLDPFAMVPCKLVRLPLRR